MEMPRKPRIVILIGDIIGIHSIEANQPVEVLVIRQDKDTGKDKLMRWGDGSKGLRKAVNEVFGRGALIQRCQWHKRENVVSY